GHAPAVAEVARQSRGVADLARDREPLTVRRREGAPAPVPAHGMTVLEVHDRSDRRPERLLAEIPGRAPGQAVVSAIGDRVHVSFCFFLLSLCGFWGDG